MITTPSPHPSIHAAFMALIASAALHAGAAPGAPLPAASAPAPLPAVPAFGARAHRVERKAGTPKLVTPSALEPATAVGKQTTAATLKVLAHTPAVPARLRNASGAQDCAAHVGLIGALVCADLVRSGRLLLVWDWHAGAGPDEIDGYRIYRVDGGKRLIGTRADKKELTLLDVALPPAGYVGTCYAVSAYAGAFESRLSPAYCPTRAQTMVAATPTIKPATAPARAPSHVDIHVTDDSYPNDTIVAAGGTVTWINDDADAHSLYGSGGSWGGELEGHGGRHTQTFRDIGRNYVVTYNCEYHADMRGRISVVVNH